MPHRKSAYASWNCIMQSAEPSHSISQKHDKYFIEDKDNPARNIHSKRISVTFDMNRLQRIPGPEEPGSPGRIFVSLNPTHSPRNIMGTYTYHHPLFSSASFQASEYLHLINGVKSLSFAGAWMGYGFHEDGFRSGLDAAKLILDSHKNTSQSQVTETQNLAPKWCFQDLLCRAILQLLQLLIRFFSGF